MATGLQQAITVELDIDADASVNPVTYLMEREAEVVRVQALATVSAAAPGSGAYVQKAPSAGPTAIVSGVVVMDTAGGLEDAPELNPAQAARSLAAGDTLQVFALAADVRGRVVVTLLAPVI